MSLFLERNPLTSSWGVRARLPTLWALSGERVRLLTAHEQTCLSASWGLFSRALKRTCGSWVHTLRFSLTRYKPSSPGWGGAFEAQATSSYWAFFWSIGALLSPLGRAPPHPFLPHTRNLHVGSASKNVVDVSRAVGSPPILKRRSLGVYARFIPLLFLIEFLKSHVLGESRDKCMDLIYHVSA